MKDRTGRYIKIVSIISSLSVLYIILTIISSPKSIGYEVSIYGAYPIAFWFALTIPFIAIIGCIIVILAKQMKISDNLRVLLITLTISASISAIIIIIMPFIRGYAFFNPGDSLTHLGYISDVLTSGKFDTVNFYPITHIIVATSSLILDIDSKIVMLLLICPSFLLIFSSSMFLVIKKLWGNTLIALVVFTISILPILGTENIYVAPSIEAFLIVPFIIFVTISSRKVNNDYRLQYSILLTFLLVLMPFFHPEACLFLAIILILLELSILFLRRHPNLFFRNESSNIFFGEKMSTPIMLLIVGFIAWFSSSVAFGGTLNNIYQSIFLNLGTSPIDQYSNILSQVNVSISELLSLILLLYGVLAILIIYYTVFQSQIIKNVIFRKKVRSDEFVLSFVVTSLFVLSVLFLFKDLIIGPRPIKYLILSLIILLGYIIHRNFLPTSIQSIKKIQHFVKSLIFISIIGLVLISIVTVYPSPIKKEMNYQVTFKDLSGMSHFFNRYGSEFDIYVITTDPQRYGDALRGFEYNRDYANAYSIHSVPSHFNYLNSSLFGLSITGAHYMIFNEQTEIFYPEVYPEYSNEWKFTASDFAHLDSDSSISVTYNNGGIKIFCINDL